MAFDQAKADEICARLSEGETLASICRTPGMPKVRTVWDWQNENPDFATSIARAREVGYDVIAQDALRIADTTQEGVIIKTDADGVTETREDMLGHRRLQIDTRLKLLAKWDPKRYGDRTQHDVDAKLEITLIDATRRDAE